MTDTDGAAGRTWRGQHQRGFTLLELLIATGVFAVVAMLAYGGLSSVLTAHQETSAGAARLRSLQQFMQVLQRDLDQLANRGIRDEYGDVLPPLHGDAEWIEFTRGGWSNPAALTRSSLQRVAYARRDRQLVRGYWPVLDRAPDSAALEGGGLDQVLAVRWRYLDEDNQWLPVWPPPGLQQEAGAAAAQPLPRALELTVELVGLGRLTRLFPLV